MTTALAPGTLIAERYRVQHILGAGGMGVVVAARHVFLNQDVAVKVLRAGANAPPTALLRFEREARLVARFRGEHVARVLDAGHTESGELFIAMELLQGRDLEEEIRARGRLEVQEAVRLVLQACEGLAEAHALGIIHRDLKPANLFLTKRPDGSPLVKILDFGISKVMEVLQTQGEQELITGTAVTIGSPAYMSPEQLRSSRDVDLRTDIWSLGVVLFRLVGGKLPFAGDTFTELLLRVMTEPPVDLLSLQPPPPANFVAVVNACLAKDSEQRPADLAELARRLAPFGGPEASETAARIKRVLSQQNVESTLSPTEMALEKVRNVAAPLVAAAPVVTPAPRVDLARRWGVVGAVAMGVVAAALAMLWERRDFPSNREGAPAVATPQVPPVPSLQESQKAAEKLAPASEARADAAAPAEAPAPTHRVREARGKRGSAAAGEEEDEALYERRR